LGVLYKDTGNDTFSQDALTESAKRRVPSEFDETTNLVLKNLSKQRPTPFAEQEELWTNASPNRALVDQVEGVPASHRQMNGLEPVQELDEVVAPKIGVNEVEDEMGVPRGFIAFVKYGLVKYRLSVQSMISASGTIASRFSSRRSSRKLSVDLSPPQDSDPFFYSPYISNSAQPQLAQNNLIRWKEGRQETDLFLELRLAGATDNDVAVRLRQLLQGCGPRARSVVNERNSRREIPLEVALSLGNVPACEVLLQFGADVRSRTSDGKSLSEFGRIAQGNTSHSPTYIAIGACRNRILEHPREGEGKKRPWKTEKTERNADISSTAEQDLERASHNTASGFSSTSAGPPSSQHVEHRSRSGGSLSSTSVNHNSTHFYTSNPLSRSGPVSKTDLSSQVIAGYQPSMSSRPSISSHRAPTPDVSNLVNYYNSVSQHQPQQTPQITYSPEGQRPPTQLWNSCFGPEWPTGLPALTPLGGGPATLDMSPGFDNNTGRFGLLLDGRMASILPSGGNMAPSAAVRSPTYAPLINTSHRAGGFFEMIGPGQFQAQNTPSWSSQLNGLSSTNPLSLESVEASYSHTSDAAILNSLEFQNVQQPSFGGVDHEMNTQPPIPPLPSATYEPYGNQINSYNMQATAPIDIWAASSRLPSSLQQNNSTMSTQLPDTFRAEFEELGSLSLLSPDFVPGWNYQSSFS
jgi:hypothetical protein